jgi:UDP-N-acetylglucosamine 3-dehydrogenase
MIRLGIVGLGHIATTHLAAAEQIPDFAIAAATRSRSVDAVLVKYPRLKIYDRPDDLLGDRSLDAVIICVPTYLHEEFVVAAARAGKHILCEKPFALDVRTAERMLDAVRTEGVTLMIAQVLRFWPEYVRVRETVTSGRLGDLLAVSAWRLATYPPWGSWFRDPEKSGGCLLDLQIHDIDFVHWLMGPPETVFARGLQSSTGSWDHVVTTLGYPGSLAHVEASYFMPPGWPFRMGFRASGSVAAIEYDWRVVGNIEERAAAERSVRLFEAGKTPFEVPIERTDAYVEQLKYFVRQITLGQAPDHCPPEESLAVMRVMAACRESAETGAPIRLKS